MAKNFVANGDVIHYVAGGTVLSGAVVVMGDLVGFAQISGVSGDIIPVRVGGVWSVTKVGSQAWAIGDRVYWDAGNSRFTSAKDPTFVFAGVAYAAVGSGAGATTGLLRLNDDVSPQCANQAHATGVDGSGSNAAPLTAFNALIDKLVAGKVMAAS
jgi:predicted RecA/RadA family phage recombinase